MDSVHHQDPTNPPSKVSQKESLLSETNGQGWCSRGADPGTSIRKLRLRARDEGGCQPGLCFSSNSTTSSPAASFSFPLEVGRWRRGRLWRGLQCRSIPAEEGAGAAGSSQMAKMKSLPDTVSQLLFPFRDPREDCKTRQRVGFCVLHRVWQCRDCCVTAFPPRAHRRQAPKQIDTDPVLGTDKCRCIIP